jgi:(p)ppGpp synthase/HD superfamily hydrolase
VIDFGDSEDQAMAGLLHDALEDCGAAHEAMFGAQFGDTVADTVKVCTDGTAESKAQHTDPEVKRRDWLARKRAYLAHLKADDDLTLPASACDKLHNVRASCRILKIRCW